MRELAEALKKRAGLRMRQGVVSAVNGSTCSVFVGGSTVAVDGVQHLNSCAPQAGDVVWIMSDGADLWIVGTHGDPPPIDPALLPTFETYFTDADTPGAPSPVAGLAGAAGFTQITLSWTLPAEAMWRTWQVFEGTTSGFTPGTPILTTDKTVVSIPHVTGSGPWYYKVRAINSLGVASTDVQVGPFTLAAVTAVDIGPGSVLATALAANAVDLASAVVTGQVAAAKIADGAIAVAKLADNAVTQAKIAAGAITEAELANPPVPGAVLELNAATADSGILPGQNDPLTARWFDTSHNGHHGTLTGFGGETPWAGAGTPADPCRCVLPGTDAHVVTASTASLSLGAMSMEAWIYIGSPAAYYDILNDLVSGWAGSFGMWLRPNPGAQIGFGHNVAGTRYGGVLTYDFPAPGWRHVFCAIDGAGALTAYVDGVSKVVTPYSPMEYAHAASVALSVGKGPNTPFNSAMAVVRIYPFVPTPAQVAQNYRAGFTRPRLTAFEIGTTELAAHAVTAGKIAAGTITANEIAANTIVGGNIAADGIVAANIAAGAITASELAAESVITAKIAAGAVTTNELAALSVTAAKIAAGTITADKLTAGTLTAAQIAAGTITAAKLNVADVQAAVVTAVVVNALTLNAIEITGGTITGATIRTAASGARTELVSTFQGVKFYSGQTGETAPGSIASSVTGYLKDIVITSPNFGSGVASVRISKEFGSLGIITLDAAVVQATGHIYVGGRVDIQTDWSEQGSNDGIWIQDSFDGPERWHLYYNSNTKRLTVSNGTNNYDALLA